MDDAAARITSWARAHAARLGVDPADTDARPLGAGENYDAWRVGSSLVFRLARHPLAELPRPMPAQLAALEVAPSGIGPRPVLAEESPTELGAPFVVTTFVPGESRPAGEWDDALLTAHARQLAVLHGAAFERCGEVGTATSERFSLVALLEGQLEWWRRHDAAVFDDPDVRRLRPRVTASATAAEPEFARLDRFALVHGECVLTNIVVAQGTPRFIDWEWAVIGDPVADLALVGGPVAAPPWYLPMTGGRLELFLDAYAEATRTRRRDALGVRRDAYEVVERFLTVVHLLHRGSETATREALVAGLTARLA